MGLKLAVLYGIILAIVVLAVANVAWMANPAYVDGAAIITIIVLTLILAKFYIGKAKPTMKDMITAGIIWIIVTAIFDVANVLAFGLNFVTYYSNLLIYVGYVLILVLAIVGYKLFGTKTAKATEQTSQK